jgi:NADP-dependent 3-hydroxy acid dehydrogenase YdfG
MGEASDRVAVVTGASAGIGEAIARELVSGGWRVVINARRKERLEELATELNAARGRAGGGVRVVCAAGDAADKAVIEAMLDRAKASFGREADAVVVNAGRGLAGSVFTSDESQWEDMVRTNLLGAARLMRAAAGRMVGATEGAPEGWVKRARDIVVIGSIVGRHVSPFSSMYGSTKFGVHGLAEGLRRELGPRGIRVTLIEPGFVVSEFQGVAGYKDEWFKAVVDKIGPVLQPADVARAVGFVLAQPAHMHVSDIVVRPTRQEYP